jgi:translation initiation factor 1
MIQRRYSRTSAKSRGNRGRNWYPWFLENRNPIKKPLNTESGFKPSEIARKPSRRKLPMNNDDLVYSTDPAENKRCARCKKLVSSCTCSNADVKPSSSFTAVLHFEKAHRQGKEVTVIDHLPASESFLKNLSGELKKRCGSGGTYKTEGPNGIIEIQGNKRDLLIKELTRLGIKCK